MMVASMLLLMSWCRRRRLRCRPRSCRTTSLRDLNVRVRCFTEISRFDSVFARGPAESRRGASDAVLAKRPTVKAAAPAASPTLRAEFPADDLSLLRVPPSSGTAAAADGVVEAKADARTLAEGVPARYVSGHEAAGRAAGRAAQRTGTVLAAASDERPAGAGELGEVIHAVLSPG